MLICWHFFSKLCLKIFEIVDFNLFSKWMLLFLKKVLFKIKMELNLDVCCNTKIEKKRLLRKNVLDISTALSSDTQLQTLLGVQL